MNRKIFALLLTLCLSLPGFSESPREVLKFDFGWKFNLGDIYDARTKEFEDSGWRDLDLPHDWSIEQEFSPDNASCTGYLPGGIGWYRKTFDIPESYRTKIVTVQFDAIYNNSEVWINGHFLGYRPNGYISFEYDLTPYLVFGGENVISVRVDHSKYADTRWYSGSGIYRHVWLIVTSPVHVASWGTFITTPLVSNERAEILIETTISNSRNEKKQVKLKSAVVTDRGQILAEQICPVRLEGMNIKVSQTISIASPVLWDTENPYLYKIISTITDGRDIIDVYETTFGIRSIHFDSAKGFLLNGKNVKMKGVCLHHDGGCVGTAVPERIWEIRLRKLKDAGCNAIRTSHNPVAPEFLELCDRMGFLVMDEAFDEWEYAKRKWINGWNNTISGLEGYSQYFREWAEADLKAMIERDKNHPSIIMWSIGNEIDFANDPYADLKSSQGQQHQDYSVNRPDAGRMVEIGQRLVNVIKEIDTTRPVTMALANIENSRRIGLTEILDIIGYNYTENRYTDDHRKYPLQVIYGSENPHNYDGWLSVKNNEFISSQFLWTGVDYLGEAGRYPVRSAFSGLLDLTGHEKTIYYWRKSMWSSEPMLFVSARARKEGENMQVDPMSKLAWFVSAIDDKQHWNYSKGDTILVTAFTNCPEAELFLNGISYGRKRYNPANSCIWWYIPFEAGEVKVVSRVTGSEDLAASLKTVSQPVKMEIRSESDTIMADGQDVVLIEVTLKDMNSNTSYLADNRISFIVEGEGQIIGTDNGDAACLDNMKLPWRNAYQGRCIAVVQSTRNKGKILITAMTEGLPTASVEVISEYGRE